MMGRFSRRLMFTGGLGFVAGSVLSSCAVSRPAPSRTEGFSSSPSPTEEPLKVIDPELKTARPDIVKLYEDETGWVISQDQSPLKGELLEPHPAETLEDSKVFTWFARLNVDADALVFYADTKGSRPLADVLRLQPGEMQLQIAYVEGKWRLDTAYHSIYTVS